jgi:hypothetical protein
LTIDNVTICNSTIGDVTSVGGSGVGAGNALADWATSSIGRLLISRSQIKLSRSEGFGSGIGAGHARGNGVSRVDYVTIWCSTVMEASSAYGPGIGSPGASTLGSSSIGVLLISSSRIALSIGSWISDEWMLEYGGGSGIGTARCYNGGVSMIDNATIWNSIVMNSSSSAGTGIGTGGASDLGARSSIGILRIASSFIGEGNSLYSGYANSYGYFPRSSGIGTGFCFYGGISTIDNVTIWNSTILEARSGYGCGIGTGGASNRGCDCSIGVLLISSSLLGNGRA